MLQAFVESVDIVLEGSPDGALALCRCKEYKTVCLGKGENPKVFFYFYSFLYLDIHVFLLMSSPWRCCTS